MALGCPDGDNGHRFLSQCKNRGCQRETQRLLNKALRQTAAATLVSGVRWLAARPPLLSLVVI
jgi:hypothetical protein